VYCVESAYRLDRKKASCARKYFVGYRHYVAAAREGLKSENCTPFPFSVEPPNGSRTNNCPIGLGQRKC